MHYWPLLPALIVLTIIPLPAHAIFTASIAIDQAQLANLSVQDKQVSIRWRMVDQNSPVLITLFFHAFQDSGRILDEALISFGRFGYSPFIEDPSGVFTVRVTASLPGQDGRLVFEVETDIATPSVTVTKFTGVTGPEIGLPGTSVFRAVITARSELVDVIIGNSWIAGFSWDNVKVGNETFPQVFVYDTTGAQIDGRLVTSLNIHLLPIKGSSGFWITAREVLANGVSWFLESDFAIAVRPNQGFQVKSLPFLSDIQLIRADLDGRVPEAGVSWLLPLGADQFDLFVSGFKIPNPDLGTILDLSYAPTGITVSRNENTGIYTAKFKPVRLGLTIPVTITTLSSDGKYESTTRVEFRPHPFYDPESSFNYITALLSGFLGTFGLVVGLFMYRRRRPRRFEFRELESLL